MAGQGSFTRAIAARLDRSEWTVVYTCIPNTPHIGVVPIPTPDGTSSQRYPDILACNGAVTKFIEVEIRLNGQVASDILRRMTGYRDALQDPGAWARYRGLVKTATGIDLPETFEPCLVLAICSGVSAAKSSLVALLESEGVSVLPAIGVE